MVIIRKKNMTKLEIKENISEVTLNESNDMLENGNLFKRLSGSWQEMINQSEELSSLFGEAIAKKIWLGFVHPDTGRIASFIYRDNNGDVSDALSFKMWVSASPAKGGLGIDNLGLIENLLRGNQRVFDQVLPLLLDEKSIKKANEIREAQGEKPLQMMGYSKRHYLDKITKAPHPAFSELYQKNLPFQIVGRSADAYLKLSEAERQDINGDLEKIAKSNNKNEIINELAFLFEIPLAKTIRINISDPYCAAKQIFDAIGKEVPEDFIANLSKNLAIFK